MPQVRSQLSLTETAFGYLYILQPSSEHATIQLASQPHYAITECIEGCLETIHVS